VSGNVDPNITDLPTDLETTFDYTPGDPRIVAGLELCSTSEGSTPQQFIDRAVREALNRRTFERFEKTGEPGILFGG
jgi:hypothetical protein